jgi:hypothetical protein
MTSVAATAVKLQANSTEASRVRNDIGVISARGCIRALRFYKVTARQFVGLNSAKLNRRQQNAPVFPFQHSR